MVIPMRQTVLSKNQTCLVKGKLHHIIASKLGCSIVCMQSQLDMDTKRLSDLGNLNLKPVQLVW